MLIKILYFRCFRLEDSKIVISWLSSHPRKWKAFVANRTSETMEVLPTKHWRHVPSKENPLQILHLAVLILNAYKIACYGGKDHPGKDWKLLVGARLNIVSLRLQMGQKWNKNQIPTTTICSHIN
ncbi:hypothetical protein TNCT_12301 [Trichonephila clavata]|uniref:Uncharacterized protein n=1 Tax=Trichonephila clavata TaxID=2740835 RepID=A0A8X6HHP6_TRICU|nr:hypothetical protein TNCT_12301 [Trichonephila clavata]